MKATAHRTRGAPALAFTLVELLVVIGIISLLVSILLPSLSRARESARQTKCLSNLRQLGIAFVMYTNDNDGKFPYAGRFDIPRDEDWLWWQETPYAGRTVADPTQSPIARYTNGFNADYFRCPSDDPGKRLPPGPGGRFLYSYTMNYLFEDSPYPDPNGYRAPKLSNIHLPSEKIFLVEEESGTMNDSIWVPPLINPDDPSDPEDTPFGFDLLSVRHDRAKATPDFGGPFSPTHFPNADRRGNAAFADGHAEFVTRRFAHDPRHLDTLR